MRSDQLRLEVDPAVSVLFPEMRVAWFTCRNLQALASTSFAHSLIYRAKETWNHVSEHQISATRCVAAWRSAYAVQGVDPSKYEPRIETLIRRFAADRYERFEVPLIDLMNAISAIHGVPIKSYNIEGLRAHTIRVRFGADHDAFDPQSGEPEWYPITERTAVYADGSRVLTWCLNHQDSCATAVANGTEAVVMVAESVDRAQYAEHARALKVLRRTLLLSGAELSPLELCGAGINVFEPAAAGKSTIA
ncbi:phenylalanine--tRNA ligase beta subunit-related protein [Bradyrhizobium japonicum]|uniref:phenylalanine--tRNA ligase beta subunit-related protein n=1 Tax=Bradyrhizobium japonicum TaxID=375 RepID=UPI0012FD7322|nr:phenylalanine--tRNA ligase beta subunit-related protein [Bradyrhizobium japonicum]